MEKSKSKKRRILVSAILTGALAMTGCAGAGSAVSQAPGETGQVAKKTKLTMWAWDDSFNVKAAKLAKDYYEKEHPDVEIEVVSRERNEIVGKLDYGLAAQAYENLPDIVLVEDYEIQEFFLKYEDEFAELSDVLDYSEFMDYKTSLVSREGRCYGIPFDSGAAVMFYRLDLIEKAGYKEEDMEDLTWERFIEIGKAVREKTGAYLLTVEPKDLGIIRIMLQSAGKWYVGPNGTDVDIEGNQVLKDAICIYKKLLDEGVACTALGWDEFVSAFQSGKVASVVSGCWIASTIQESEEQAGCWRVARIPKMGSCPESVNASNIGGSSWYLLKNKGNVEEAKEFMAGTFGENKEFLNELVGEINLVSTRKDAGSLPNYQTPNEYFGNEVILRTFAKVAEEVPGVNYGLNTYDAEEQLSSELQSIINGSDVDEALHRVQIKVVSIIGDAAGHPLKISQIS
ncbi:ABC transporter substrate-binding protein [Murimonas intestini]|uniref:Carbohydrate ABC transporter substrate-binding protein (CUT1 family) n=1 Tax=Murimonas intestini TaxID=1337051 RepID=A0AB73SZA0_9FIRM|nr:extracellular solute-binding protein [Murimonas intestini]MCR1842893.1 extracellular solute-binding protein [Murimonas intestini]MCR1868143.1 extracellular solute-binding protein [Murimonas intestini]MCR1885365.1 extracellular solute-binding protein [Murimonas intestini]